MPSPLGTQFLPSISLALKKGLARGSRLFSLERFLDMWEEAGVQAS